MIMHLDKVPAREEAMEPFEFMLSESQERMLICAKSGYEDKVLEIFRKWDLDAEIIGEVTNSGNMELFWHGERVADIPVLPVGEEAPIYDRPVKKPSYLDEIKDISIDDFERVGNQEAFDNLFARPEVVDKSWISEQYDSMVQTNTIKNSGSLDASAIRIKESGKALAMSSDCNPRYNYIDPFGGAAAAVMESGRNVAMSGARPKAITDCLNYGNPENPEIMWQFAQGCYGIKEACAKLNTPVVSGNVSLYNETDGEGIYPTPAIAMVGVNDDANKTLPSAFQKDDSPIYLIGDTFSDFGGSLYLKKVYKKVGGVLPKIDYEQELKLWELVIEANKQDLLYCAKDVNVGGIAIALAKMSCVGDKGSTCRVDLKDDRDIFSESFSRAIVEVKDEKEFEKLAQKIGINVQKIGKTTKEKTFACNDISVDLDSLKDTYFNKFAQIIEQDI
jgi:phosphoribosylformylglycinamidine synthase